MRIKAVEMTNPFVHIGIRRQMNGLTTIVIKEEIFDLRAHDTDTDTDDDDDDDDDDL